jgi:hypothetical protein
MKRIEDSSIRGSSPEGKLPFEINVKGGEIHQMHGQKE